MELDTGKVKVSQVEEETGTRSPANTFQGLFKAITGLLTHHKYILPTFESCLRTLLHAGKAMAFS
jgi:hypothetical protein